MKGTNICFLVQLVLRCIISLGVEIKFLLVNAYESLEVSNKM